MWIFWGLHIKKGFIIPQPHITEKKSQFLDQLSTRKQIHQFLEIINYAADHVQNLSNMTSQISKHLKKGALQWLEEATKIVKYLKQKCQSLQPLKIPDSGQLILQTDARDHDWGALMIKESEGNMRIYGYKSGQFNDAQSHYPSSKKEVLAVVKGIKKFYFFSL